jgi:beta-glucosidase
MRKRRVFCPGGWDCLERRIALSAGGGTASTAQAVQVGDPSPLPSSPADTPDERLDADAAIRHEAVVARAQAGGDDVVFFGDSITEWWQLGDRGLPVWNSAIAPFHAADFGVVGDQTQNLVWRLENGELDGHPKVAVVQIGTNNLFFHDANETPQETADGIIADVQAIRTLSPQTQIILLGLLPRGQSPDDPTRAEVQEVNSLIAGQADGNDVRFLDLGSLFLRPDGTISADLMPDFLHPSTQGYQLLADALQVPLSQMLGLPTPPLSTFDAPVVYDVPTDRVVGSNDPAGTQVFFPSPLAIDAFDPDPTVTCMPPSGSTFPIGTTVVTCNATDQMGLDATASFLITVHPGGPFLIQVPNDAVVDATSGAGAVVDFAPPQALDPTDPDPSVTCTPPSGSTFPIGTTVVTCNATDQSGQVAVSSFRITVRDSDGIVLFNDPTDAIVSATGLAGSVVAFAPPQVFDPFDDQTTLTCSPPSGSAFPIGTTVVTYTATSTSGPSASISFDVTVEVPQVNVASVQNLVQNAFIAVNPTSPHPFRFPAVPVQTLIYKPTNRQHNVTGASTVAFLSQVDANHDFRVTRAEMALYVSARVDLNHDGQISLVEEWIFQVINPLAARYFFPTSSTT